MTRLLCCGDIHFKLRGDIDVSWQLHRYVEFIDHLVNAARDKQAHLALLGDQFDSIDPKREELQLFFYLLGAAKRKGVTVLLVSGNHETVADHTSLLDFLELGNFPNVYYRGMCEPTDGLCVHLLNHDELDTPPTPVKGATNLLLTHVRGSINQFIREEVDVAALCSGFSLTVAGDIHEPRTLDAVSLVYTGMPLGKDFGHEDERFTWLWVEFDGESLHTRHEDVEAPRLIKRRIDVAQWPQQSFYTHHYYHVTLTGAPDELRAIENTHQNVRLHRVPDVPTALDPSEWGEVEEADVAETLEQGLSNHMQSLGLVDAEVAEMLKLLREEAA